ncbi:HES6 protein, partial [Cercotrichas coryphoeus]|nr:HES6 protein [Cercotrichas coryphoeus]
AAGAAAGGAGPGREGLTALLSPQTRKPLVEKKRRARINESLRELRLLLADSEVRRRRGGAGAGGARGRADGRGAPGQFQAKLENAEVLERTVRRVRAVLERRARGGGRRLLEASERFAAGYIQCMHEVHTFVSSCPGIDATTAAELLNHLLESMPLSEGGCPDSITDVLGQPALGAWPAGEALALPAAARPGLALPPPAEETCSDSDEAEAEPGQTGTDGLDASQTQGLASPKCMWRPW